MPIQLSSDLQKRLQRIANQRGCDIEQLIVEYVDQIENTGSSIPVNFFDSSLALLCIADLRGIFHYVNPAFFQTLGYSKDEIVGQPYDKFIHPDDLEATQHAETILDEGKSLIHFENRYRCRDGSYRWLSWATNTYGDLIYAIATDITQEKKFKQDLEKNLSQNQHILNAMFDGFILIDPLGNILDANSNYCEMLGYTHQEILQKTIYDLDTTLTPTMSPFITDDEASILETRHRHKSGSLIDIEFNSIQLTTQQIACFIRDISGRKQLEQQINQSVKRYQGLIESQIDFVCRYTPDTRLIYVNDAYCRFFQRTREELIGHSFLTLTEDINTSRVHERINQLRTDPSPGVDIYHNYDREGNKKWVQWVDYGITDEDGQLIEVQAVGRDITSLINTQQTLMESEKMLTSIFDNVPILLAQFDEMGSFEYVNKYFIDVLGWTLDEISMNPNMLEEFYPDPEVREDAIRFMSELKDWKDFKTRAKNGEFIDITWTNVSLPHGRTLGIGQVITQRIELENQRIYARQLELELEKEQELRMIKDRFVSLISHEFRTPLATMMTSLDMMIHHFDKMTKDQFINRLEGLQSHITRMVTLMEDTLRFSKARSGQIQIFPKTDDIYLLFQNVIDIFDNANIELISEHGNIHTDQGLFNLILTNLISNAIKYSTSGKITVRGIDLGDRWQISVQDEGIGIPQQDLPQVFRPFYRASNTQDLPGTGLGLAIVKDYVEIQGGNISVDSTFGKGTTFTVILPKHLPINQRH